MDPRDALAPALLGGDTAAVTWVAGSAIPFTDTFWNAAPLVPVSATTVFVGGAAAVNGTFQGVTSYFPSLGLEPVVLNALANTSLRNDGAYSPPTYTQPHSSTSAWQAAGTAVWNTLSGIAEVTGITKVVSVVWNAVQSAEAYLGEAVTVLSTDLGLGKLANQFVKGLEKIASAMEWALEQLVNYIITLVKQALAAIVDPIINLAQNYYSNLNSSLASGNAVQFANALDGPFFLLVLGLATAVEVALTLLTPIDLGPSFLVGLLIGLLISIALQSAATSGIVSALNGVTNFGGQMIRDVQGWVNTTSASANVKLPTRYNTEFSVFSAVASLAVVPFSIGLMGHAFGLTGEQVTVDPTVPAIAFALAIITLGFHIVFALDHVPIPLLILGMAFGTVAVLLTYKTLQGETSGLWRVMGDVDVGVSAIALGTTVYEALSETI